MAGGEAAAAAMGEAGMAAGRTEVAVLRAQEVLGAEIEAAAREMETLEGREGAEGVALALTMAA